MRIAFRAATFLAFLSATSAMAQQSAMPISVESLRGALQKKPQRSISIPDVPWVSPTTTRLGMLTLVPPDTNGEVVKIVIPIGGLVSRAARGVSRARRDRAERRAHEEVSRALRDFEAQQVVRQSQGK